MESNNGDRDIDSAQHNITASESSFAGRSNMSSTSHLFRRSYAASLLVNAVVSQNSIFPEMLVSFTFNTVKYLLIILALAGGSAKAVASPRSSTSFRICSRWYSFYHVLWFIVSCCHYPSIFCINSIHSVQDLNGSNLTLRSRNCYVLRHKVSNFSLLA